MCLRFAWIYVLSVESVLLILVASTQRRSHSTELLPSWFTAGMFLKV